ncbi:hypothetical protein [Vannielia sp.]|uniref:hypothetical protein n=1 Tax=Vannielia sp. TaxID=2813045 RepID=UPI002632B136|nr:hypothetical protein [Vannielia sp.]
MLAFFLYKQGFDGGGPAWVRIVLTLAGTAVMVMGVWLWSATEATIVLEDGELRTSNGRLLARVDQVLRVEKGAMSIKPVGGFTLKLKEKGPRGWAPGLWWSLGKTVAVGGVTHPAMGKAMAQLIEAEMLALRQADEAD